MSEIESADTVWAQFQQQERASERERGGIKDIINLHFELLLSIVLLVGSLTYGFSSLAFDQGKKGAMVIWPLATFAAALAFVLLEQHQFAALIAAGHDWKGSAFLSIFFTLLGVHWIHVIVSIAWMAILLIQFMTHGLNDVMRTRLTCLGMFVNFLNIIWIFIFTMVYLMGAI